MPKAKKTVDDDMLGELELKLGELTDALQRERADSVNMRRQHEEQVNLLRQSTKSQLIKQLLPVIDNFDRSLRHIPKELVDNDYIKGVQAVVKQFEKTLSDIGVERIKTVGEVFNPHEHEAVSMEDGQGSHEVVSEELQAGYKINDHVIRHAMVKVKMGDLKK